MTYVDGEWNWNKKMPCSKFGYLGYPMWSAWCSDTNSEFPWTVISYWVQYMYTCVHPATLSSWQPYKTMITDCISLFERHTAGTFSDFEIVA